MLVRDEISTELEIEAGIELLAEIATADPFGFAALRALPGATFIDSPPPCHVALAVVDGYPRSGDVARLPPGGRGMLERLGTAVVRCGDDCCMVTWARIETDHERLQAGIDLLRTLAYTPSQGVYR